MHRNAHKAPFCCAMPVKNVKRLQPPLRNAASLGLHQIDGWGQGAVAGSRGASGWAPATAAESQCAAGRFILTFIEWSSMWDGSFWISGYVF